MVKDQLLQDEAKKQGKADVDALLKTMIEDKTVAPTDQEITDFYPVVQRQLGGATLEEARPLLAQELTRRKQQDAFAAYIEQLQTTAGLSTNLPYPDLPRVDVTVTPDDPIRGNPNAPITIVQFADYQCYYCNKVQPTIDRVLTEYDGKVRLVYKDFPLPAHSRAQAGALAAHCAGEQGKYWEMNASLMANQSALGDGDLQGYAQAAGVDMPKYNACLASGKWEPIIAASAAEGQRAGVSATPTFFVDGTLISGAQGYERFKSVIERQLAAKSGG
jgi:protein-disulfide isomerase